MFLLINERYKTYQKGFLSGRLGHAPGLGLWDTMGGRRGKKNTSEFQPDLMCEIFTWMTHATAQFFFGPHPPKALGRGQRSNIIKSQLLNQFQRFLNQTVCVFSQMNDIKTSDGIFIWSPGWHVPGVGLGVNFFSKIQPDLVCELLTWMAHATAQYFGSPPPGAFGRDQMVKYH